MQCARRREAGVWKLGWAQRGGGSGSRGSARGDGVPDWEHALANSIPMSSPLQPAGKAACALAVDCGPPKAVAAMRWTSASPCRVGRCVPPRPKRVFGSKWCLFRDMERQEHHGSALQPAYAPQANLPLCCTGNRRPKKRRAGTRAPFFRTPRLLILGISPHLPSHTKDPSHPYPANKHHQLTW